MPGTDGRTVPIDVAKSLMTISMRANAVAVWRDAASSAEDMANFIEGRGPTLTISAPQALRSAALAFRKIACDLMQEPINGG